MSDLLSQLAGLPAAEPDPARSLRVRQRCHATLARNTARRPAPTATRRPAWHAAWPAAIAGLGALYMAAVLALAAELFATR